MTERDGSVGPGISAVLPALDEVESLAATTAAVLAALGATGRPFEVIVVDDGSTDGTAVLADRLAVRHAEVHAVHHARNRGYGAAVRSGVTAARLPWVFLTDADGQFDPGEIDRLLALAAHADLVAGYRRRRADPWHRRLYGRVFSRAVVPAVLGVRARDVNCAFKLVRRDLAAALDLRADGALVSAELLGKARLAGARIVETPVTHGPRRAGRPSGGSALVILRAARELVAVRRDLRAFADGAPRTAWPALAAAAVPGRDSGEGLRRGHGERT